MPSPVEYAWPIGTSTSPVAGDLEDAEDELFGRDIWFDVTQGQGADYIVTPAGDWKEVRGHEALRQSLIRRFITNPGEWQTLPEFGAGARLFVKAKNTRAARDELTARLKAQALADPRVASVEAVVIEKTETLLRIAVQVIPKGQIQRNRPLTVAFEVS